MNQVLKILLVEDNPDDLLLFLQAYKKAGVDGHVQSVSDGQEARAYLSGEGIYRDRNAFPFPDVMLLDLNMPQMNGFEVLEWVRKHPTCHRLMVHVLTTSIRESDVHRAYDLYVNSYLVKPSRVDDLVNMVKALHQWHRYTAMPRRPSPVECAVAVH